VIEFDGDGAPGLMREVHDPRFHRLLDVMPAAAYTCDPDGLITYFNRRAAEVWGREPKLNDPEDRYCGSFRLAQPDGTPILHERCWMALTLQENCEYNGREIVIERPDGSSRTALAHANPFHDAAGRLQGAVNVLVDITDRKRDEEALRDAERRRERFLAVLAHELRNPLAPMANAVELLRLASDEPATREMARNMLKRQLSHMVRLVNDLMDASRLTHDRLVLHKERVELASILRHAVESVRTQCEERSQTLTVEDSSPAVVLDADPIRLVQIFINLLNNAIKYTDPGGCITLRSRVVDDRVQVDVKDNGVGIPTDKLELVFEQFAQVDSSLERSRGGLGIGLSLVRGLVTMHGGNVTASSEGPGRGSTFRVCLPVLEESFPRGPLEA
jgi:PAS domain S-box-containing protein